MNNEEEERIFGMTLKEVAKISTAKKMCQYGLICGDADFVMSKELIELEDNLVRGIISEKRMTHYEFYLKLIGYGLFKIKEREELDAFIKKEKQRMCGLKGMTDFVKVKED